MLGRGDPGICLALAKLCFPVISKLLTTVAMGPQSLEEQPLACCADRHLEASSLARANALVSPSSV